MPLRETQCSSCGHEWEQLIHKGESPDPCPHCESTKVEVLISAHGGYQGSFGGGSTRPRNAGSFKRAKQ